MRTKSTQGFSIRLVIGLAVIILLAFLTNGFFAARAEWRLRSQLAAIRAAGDPASITDLTPRAIPDDENAAAIMKQVERQGQRQLSGCSGKDFQQEVVVPGAAAAFADNAIAAGMLLQQG